MKIEFDINSPRALREALGVAMRTMSVAEVPGHGVYNVAIADLIVQLDEGAQKAAKQMVRPEKRIGLEGTKIVFTKGIEEDAPDMGLAERIRLNAAVQELRTYEGKDYRER